MWGRVIEISAAVWLAVSPFVFRAADNATLVWADNLIALAIVTLAGFSFWHPTRYAHLLTLLVALGLIVWGRFTESTPLPPYHQNHIVIGLFLLMIALIPNDASAPPAAWRKEGEPV